jgi:hypothetical protein
MDSKNGKLIGHGRIFYRGLRRTTTNLSQNSLCAGLDSNRAPPQYKSKAIQLEPALSVSGDNDLKVAPQGQLFHRASRGLAGLFRS